jgi:hypothetical protein
MGCRRRLAGGLKVRWRTLNRGGERKCLEVKDYKGIIGDCVLEIMGQRGGWTKGVMGVGVKEPWKDSDGSCEQ